MLHDFIELLIDQTTRRHGWTWQRYVFAPIIASAIVLALIYLVFITARWWLPGLLAVAF